MYLRYIRVKSVFGSLSRASGHSPPKSSGLSTTYVFSQLFYNGEISFQATYRQSEDDRILTRQRLYVQRRGLAIFSFAPWALRIARIGTKWRCWEWEKRVGGGRWRSFGEIQMNGIW